jgi:hypothetical protein
MTAVLEEWTEEAVCSVIHFLWAKKVPRVEIHRELVTVCGGNVLAVQYVDKWYREFGSGLSKCEGGTVEWSAFHIC